MRGLAPEEVKATLIVAKRRLLADPLADMECGWRSQFRVSTSTASTRSTSTLEEPWVAEVAAIFRSRLDGDGRDDTGAAMTR